MIGFVIIGIILLILVGISNLMPDVDNVYKGKWEQLFEADGEN